MSGAEQPEDGEDLRPRPWAYSAFPVTVVRAVRISPSFVRITFGDPSLRHFAPWGRDQRIKVVLPMDDGSGLAEFGLLDQPTPHPSEWYTRWKQLPADRRNVLRTYTPAQIRPELGEIDVDFVIHEPGGPASAWAAGAREGDRLVLTGPDVRNGFTGYGIHWAPPEGIDRFLLVGDDTALPALRNVLAALPSTAVAHVILETAIAADAVIALAEPDRLEHPVRSCVSWEHVVRGAGTPGALMEDAVRRWTASRWGTAPNRSPSDTTEPDNLYAWIAGETGAVTRIRRHLRRDHGVPKEHISSLGYWRIGGALTE